MVEHGNAGASHQELLDEPFINQHGVAGTGEHIVERVQELVELGVGTFVVFLSAQALTPMRWSSTGP
jgi:hypothetical protein